MKQDDAGDIGTRAAQYAVTAGPLIHAQDYAQRGRSHQHLSMPELQLGFEVSLRGWAAAPFDESMRNNHLDYGAECALRGINPDYSGLKAEIDTIAKTVTTMVAGLNADQVVAMGEVIVDDFKRAQAGKN